MDAKVGEIESAKRELDSKKSALKEKSRDNGRLEVEPGAAGPRLAERRA